VGGCSRPKKAWRSNFAAGLAVVVSLGLLNGCAGLEPFELPKLSDMPWNKSAEQGAPAGQGASEARDIEAEDKALVQRVQQMLAKLGYEPGPADGVPGRKTRRAIRDYQEKSGFAADGRVTETLLDRLRASIQSAKSETPKKPAPQESQSTKAPPKAHAGSPPAYETGNTFVYSDGRVDTVVGLKGDMVRWQRNDGTKFTAHRNFLLPWAYWQSEAESGKHELEGEPGALWPRTSGQEVSFSIASVVQRGGGSGALTKLTEDWRCRLVGKRKVTVMAGTFDTLKLTCDRAASAFAPALERIWYYAPGIQHFVRLEDRGEAAGASKEVELVTIRPGGEGWPPIARAALSRAVEKALETVSNGREAPWRSSGVETRVTIKPTSRFESGDGKVCRTFLQTWSGKDGRRSYPGAACRDSSGRWQIPGLGDGADETLAISKGLS
jgi:hypothetical protein